MLFFPTQLCGVLVFCSVSRSLFVSRPLLVLLSHTQHCHTHNITQRCRTQLFHTDNFVTHNPFTCNFVTHNSSETFTDTTLSHTSGDSDAPFAWPRGCSQAWHLVTLMLAFGEAWHGDALLRAHTNTTLSTPLLHTQHCDTQHNSFTHNSFILCGRRGIW